MIPAEIAVVAAAPAGRSEPPQLSGFGRQADLEVVGLVAESGSESDLPADVTQALTQNNRGIQSKKKKKRRRLHFGI